MNEVLNVKALTKYGFQTDKGVYINWAPKLNESEKGKVVAGLSYEFDLFVADSGKKYVNGVKLLDSTMSKPAVKKTEDTVMTKQEWKDKDRSQLIGGLSHDAAALVSSFINVKGIQEVDEAVEMFRGVLKGLLEVRDELK